MSDHWLLANPPTRPQWRSPRRAPISGVVVLHNSGGPRVPAARLAQFIRRRNDAGSYHELGNHSADWLILLPDDVEAFGCASGDNSHAWHICLTGVDGDFDPADPATRAGISQLADRITAFWRRNSIDQRLACRMLTRDQAQARQPGIVHHGDLQPADRSDAWARSSHRATLDRMLLERIETITAGGDDVQITTTTAQAGQDLWIIEMIDGRPSRLLARIPGPDQVPAFTLIFRADGRLDGDQSALVAAMLAAQGGRRA